MLKPYKEYRYFGLPWLEVVPSHWAMLRNKNVLIEKKEVVGSSANNYLLLSLTLNGVIARDMINAKGKFPKDFNTYKVVEPGNLIFCLFDIDETPRTVGLSTLNGMITGAYDVFQPVNINGKYLYYYYLSIDNVKGLKPLYTGLRKVINIQTFLGTKLPVPPKEEQDQIVRFLDWKLSKINKLIRAKKKQIALLNEQKQVIINNAVTKGLNPNVPMKDSGIEWIGQVPNQWKIYRNKNIFTLRKESVGESSKQHTLLSLTTNGIIPRDIESGKGKFPSDFNTYQKVYSGDFVFCLFDIDETPRTVGLSSYEGMITGAYTVMTPKNADSLFIYYYYLSLDNKKALKPLYTGLRKVINTDVFLRAKIALPDVNEQKQIVEYIENKINSINNAMYVIQNEIPLLTEYRTRLISDVVTGKVDVRDIEIPEYEADSDETIDDEIDDNLVLDEEDGEMEVE